MSIVRAEMEKRHARRKEIEKEASKLRPPSIHSKASKTDFDKVIKSLAERFCEESLLVTHDFKVLIMAFNTMHDQGYDVDHYIDDAWKRCPMADDKREALELREFEEREAREAAGRKDKKNGELVGQQKIVFDDGSEPEAGECVTKKLDADGNVIEEDGPETFDILEALTELDLTLAVKIELEEMIADRVEITIEVFDRLDINAEDQESILGIVEDYATFLAQESNSRPPDENEPTDADAPVTDDSDLPGVELTDEMVADLEGPDITDEQLQLDIENAQAKLDEEPCKIETAEEEAEPIDEIAAKAAKKKKEGSKPRAKKAK